MGVMGVMGVMGGASRTGDYGSNGESGCWGKREEISTLPKSKTLAKWGMRAARVMILGKR